MRSSWYGVPRFSEVIGEGVHREDSDLSIDRLSSTVLESHRRGGVAAPFWSWVLGLSDDKKSHGVEFSASQW